MSDALVQTVPLAAAHAGFSAFRAIVHGKAPVAHQPIDETPGIDRYAQGLADGQEMAAAAFAAERAHYQALLASAEKLQCEVDEELTQLIGESVLMLVSQIIETAPVDARWLNAQVKKAVGVIGDCDASRTLRLNPDDLALLSADELPLPVVTDDMLARGELRVDGSAGWIEHGRSSYLAALRGALSAGDTL